MMNNVCKRLRRTTLALSVLLSGSACLTLGVPTVQAQPLHSYAAKLVCNERIGDSVQVFSGRYLTTVNVYNPHYVPVDFVIKASRALPNRVAQDPATEITPEIPASLEPMQARGYDCDDFRRLYQSNGLPWPLFYEGFFVVMVDSPIGANEPPPMDVQVVYTAEERPAIAGGETDVRTMHVREVKPKVVIQQPQGEPNMLPVPDPITSSYCRRTGLNLTVEVENQGTAPAGASTVTVDFFAYGSASAGIPALAPGASSIVTVAIPSACFDPDCNFRITADSAGVVVESNEGNNAVGDVCLG